MQCTLIRKEIMSRPLLRATTNKTTPAQTDLLRNEQGYSYLSDKLFLRYPDGIVREIGGNYFTQLVEQHETAIADLTGRVSVLEGAGPINQNPVANPDSASITESNNGQVTGNVLTNDTDAENDTRTVNRVSYALQSKTVGQAFTTTHGSFTIQSDGAWTFTLNQASRTMKIGDSVTETIQYGIVDSNANQSTLSVLTINILGGNESPIVVADSGTVVAGSTVSGNALLNDTDADGDSLVISSFRVGGDPTNRTPGSTVNLTDVGSVTVNANGTWSITADPDYSGYFPTIQYSVTDGNATVTSGSIVVTVLPNVSNEYTQAVNWFNQYENGDVTPVNIATNPVQVRVDPSYAVNWTYPDWDYRPWFPNRNAADSSCLDFRVGPGMEYAEIGDIPWDKLLPGDRVFVYYRATPYNHVITLQNRGTSAKWIEIIGVKDSNGNKPILDATNAIEVASTSSLNSTHSSSGMIVIVPPLDGRSNNFFKPGYIHIHGLEIRNTMTPSRITDYTGANKDWGEFVAGIKVAGVDYLIVSGCYFHDNGIGVFINSTPDNGERLVSRFCHMLFNRFGNNGATGQEAYGTHNSYTEAISMIYEFNYFEPNKQGNAGDSIKDRSTGHIFRYNYFKSGSANAMSLRDPQATVSIGFTQVDSLGVNCANYSYVYANQFEFIQESSMVAHGDGIFVYGGFENQVRGNGKCFFYNNICVANFDAAGYDYAGAHTDAGGVPTFDFWNTRTLQTGVSYNNLYYSKAATQGGTVPPFSAFRYQGIADFYSNFTNSFKPTEINPAATPNAGSVNQGNPYTGTLTDLNVTLSNADPGFASIQNNDFSIMNTSPYFTLNGAHKNEVILRALTPLGLPVQAPYGKKRTPVVHAVPSITGSHGIGSVLTAIPAIIGPQFDSVDYQWYRGTNPIAGQTSLSYTVVSDDGGMDLKFRCTFHYGSTTIVSESDLFHIATTTTPQNTTAPTITGSGQSGSAVTVSNNGNWTNTPISYAVQWYVRETNGSSTLIAGQTSTSFTPDNSYIGKSIFARIKATNSGGEFGEADSNLISVIEAITDPDATGKFNFDGLNGTSLDTLSSKWNSRQTAGQYPHDYCFCTGNGALTASYVSLWNGGVAWYENSQGNNISVEIGMNFRNSGGNLGVVLNFDAVQGYEVNCGATEVTLHRNGTYVNAWNHGQATLNKLRATRSGSVISIYVNDALLSTYDDPSPLSGGYPGLSIGIGDNDLPNEFTYWTDNA